MPKPIPYEQTIGRFSEEQKAFLRDNPTYARTAWLRSLHFAEALTYAYDVGFEDVIKDLKRAEKKGGE